MSDETTDEPQGIDTLAMLKAYRVALIVGLLLLAAWAGWKAWGEV